MRIIDITLSFVIEDGIQVNSLKVDVTPFVDHFVEGYTVQRRITVFLPSGI